MPLIKVFRPAAVPAAEKSAKIYETAKPPIHVIPFEPFKPPPAVTPEIIKPPISITPTILSSSVADSPSFYKKTTEIIDKAPCVIMMSDFVPLYDDDDTQTNATLSLKEKSLFITAKNACLALGQSKSVYDVAEKNAADLLAFSTGSSVIFDILGSLSRLYDSLKLQNFATSDGLYPAKQVSMTTFGKISSFSSTKVWLQFLLDMKRELGSHDPSLIDKSPPYLKTGMGIDSKSVNDPYLLVGTKDLFTLKGVWINNSTSTYAADITQKSEAFMSSMDLLTVAAGTNDLINRTTSLRENLYTRRSSEGVISSAMSMLEGMPPYRDLTLILNVIAKEVRISRRLVLNSFTGYSVEDAKPQGIFDFLIGYIPEKSALDIVPFGDTFAQPNLVTFACETIDIDKTTSKKGIVFTLEQKDDPAQNFTAGGDYFVESSLSTTDGINFDTLNLNVLNSKIDAAVKNLNDIEKIFSVPSVSDPLPRTLENGNFSYYDLFNNEIVGPLKELTDNYKNIYMNAFFNSEKVPIKSEAIDVMGAIIRSCVSPTGKLEMKKHKLCSILFLLAISDMLDEKEGPSATTKFKEELRIRLFDEFAVNPNTISVGDAGGPGSYALGDIKTTTLEEPFVGNPYVKYYDYTWKAILSILKKFAALPIYDSNSRTAFSKIKKSTLLFSVFDACLRYIAYITPFNLLATTFGNVDRLYSLTFARAGKPEYASAAAATATDARSWVYLDPAPEYKKFANGTYVKDSVTSGAGNEYFTNGEGPPATIRSNILYALSDGKSYPENSIRCLRNYLDSLKQKARDLKSLLEKDAGKQLLIEMNSYYSGDDKATTDQRARLLNMALSPEQLLLQYYMRREVGDRTNLALSADGDSRLAAIYPAFSTFPKNHSKLLPIQEMNLVSHDLLSSFFKTAAFLPNKGNNKKILTVGVPTGLFRSIKDTSAAGFLQEFDQVKNVMLLKVYRLNRFVPEVIFKPQRFLFQMNRFPIKELTDEYEPSMFSKAVFDPLMLPAKVVSNGSVRATSYYKGRDKEAALLRLAVDEYIDLYMNHSMSFLLGEYIRWFSGINVDDGSYYNYGSIKTQSVVKAQMGAYYDAIRSKSDTENAVAYAEFELPDGSRTKRSVIDTVNSKGLTVDMTNTLMSYLTNETFLASPLEIKRRATYPKKFARVFNIIVDPDDFVIDQHNTTAEGLTGLVSRGIAVKTGGAYKLRDTTPEDVTFDDYFVTIEPYSHK